MKEKKKKLKNQYKVADKEREMYCTTLGKVAGL